MKISELVAELEVFWAEYGDIETLCTNRCDCEEPPRPEVAEFGGNKYVFLN